MENNEQIRERIEQLVNKSGLSINAFAKKAGVDQASLNKILKGSLGISSKMIEAIAEAANVEPEWIAYGTEKSSAGQSKAETRPHYTSWANAGTLTEEHGSSYELQPIIAQMPRYDFTIQIYGDSMSPTYNSGEIVACRDVSHSNFHQWGQVHVLSTSQGNIIKRIYEKGDNIECRSDNDDFPPFVIPKEEIYSFALVVGGLRKEHF